MPEARGAFAPNREDVAAKVIDGELIVIRLSDGTYYATDPVGTEVWELIVEGHDLGTVVATVAGRHAMAVEDVGAAVGAFVEELRAEGLIVPASAEASRPTEVAPPAASPGAWAPPRLQVYRDMGNLLALDPPTPGIDDLRIPDPEPGGRED